MQEESRREILGRNFEPRFMQIQRTLERRIRQGQYPVNSQLPGLDVLAAEFCVAKMTLLKAIDGLDRDRLIQRRAGRGIFVAQASEELIAIRQIPFEISVSEGNRSSRLDALEICSTATHAAALQAFGEDRCGFLERVALTASKPYGLGKYYIRLDVFEGLGVKNWKNNTVARALLTYKDSRPFRVKQTLAFDTCDFEAAHKLGTGLGSPLITVKRHFLDDDDSCLAYAEINFLAESVEFHLDVEISREEELNNMRGYPLKG